MGGGGGSAQPTSSTVTQTNLPEYAKPFYTNLMKRGQAASYQDYTPYEGQRIAEFNPAQQNAQQGVGALQAPGQIGAATDMANQAGLGALQAGQYNPSTYSPNNANASQLNNYSMQAASGNASQMNTPDAFGQAQANQYMSPYMQSVVDVQKQEAIRDAQKGVLSQNLGAARQGTYGGARQMLATTERERNLGDELGQIQATGLQNAYMNAQQQFGADRAAGMQANQYNTGAQNQFGLANMQNQQGANQQNLGAQLQTQGLGAQQNMQAQLANQNAWLQANQQNQQDRQFGANLGMQGYNTSLQAASTMGDLGNMQQQTDLQRLQAQNAVGVDQRGYEQQQLDTQYADFLRQRDYPMEQLQQYSSLLQGVPMQLNSAATTYAQPPSMVSQIGGLGLGALGTYMMNK